MSAFSSRQHKVHIYSTRAYLWRMKQMKRTLHLYSAWRGHGSHPIALPRGPFRPKTALKLRRCFTQKRQYGTKCSRIADINTASPYSHQNITNEQHRGLCSPGTGSVSPCDEIKYDLAAWFRAVSPLKIWGF